MFVTTLNLHFLNSITTLTLFNFSGVWNKIWAFGQMQFAHASIRKTPGLTFYKLMGSGKDPGFNPLPDWSVYALLCNWENEAAANDFFQNAAKFRQYQKHTTEQWTIFMKPIHVKGLWSGANPFSPASDLDETNPLIAVITRATIRKKNLVQFWRYVPISQSPILKGCKGLIYTKGIGEVPLVQMATFSIWQSMEDLKNFAYNSPEHKEAISKTHKIDWYKEEMFARFQPYHSIGKWTGKELLSPFLRN
jgi:heme-degrading monooxygenase HmoA